MARLPRCVIPGQPQHIIQRGNNRQALFGADADYRFFRGAWVEAATQQGLAIHAFVWMTHHIHVLATPESGHTISQVFRSVGRRYVQYSNAAYGRPLGGRYRATVVDSERYLLTLMRYLELNSVRAGRVTDPADYPWSSYRPCVGRAGPQSQLIDAASGVFATGRIPPERECAYRQLCQTAMALADLADIRDCSHKGWALGSERFKEHIESLAKRRATSKGWVGRKRKIIVSDPIVPFQIAMASADLADIRDCSHKGWALGSERFKEHIESLAKRRVTSKGLGRPRKVK